MRPDAHFSSPCQTLGSSFEICTAMAIGLPASLNETAMRSLHWRMCSVGLIQSKLRILRHAEEISHVAKTCRYFAIGHAITNGVKRP
jgi:hypothetical protein